PSRNRAPTTTRSRRRRATTTSGARGSRSRWLASATASTAETGPTAGRPRRHTRGPGARRRRTPRSNDARCAPAWARATSRAVARVSNTESRRKRRSQRSIALASEQLEQYQQVVVLQRLEQRVAHIHVCAHRAQIPLPVRCCHVDADLRDPGREPG